MRLTRSDRLRISLLTSLGLLPLACGARVEPSEVGGREGSLSTPASSPDISSPDAPSPEPSPPDDPPSPAPLPPAEACQGSPVIEGGIDTGLVTCSSGVVHRPAASVQCPDRLQERAVIGSPSPGCDAEPCTPPNECRTDADCTADAHGYCTTRGQLAHRVCAYGCLTDADCNADEACVCGPYIGECVKATCRSAEDCGDGLLCAQYRDLFGIGCGEPMQLACQTAADECRSSADCPGGNNCAAPDGTWRCKEVPGIACGRPFLVEGEARLAPVVARRADVLELTPRLAGLDASARERLAHAWLDVGRMEHASIAAFARFCLQLLELGAPHDLLVAAQAAMADEAEHTRLAFALASHYAGEPLGPGALPMDGALRASTLDEVLRLVVREGCVGETLAALEASEALAHSEDPVVREVLERIARDERAHAELAWRFVAWALRERPELVSVVEHELGAGAHVEARDAPARTTGFEPRATCRAGELDLLRHGVLSDAERAAVHAAAWRDVVRPCARRLLAASRARIEPQPSLS